jgi:hypothetical protein
MTLSVQLVPLSLVHQTWHLVEKFIEDALKWGEDDYTIEQARQNIADGKWMLVVAVDEQQVIHGAAAINIYNMPNFRVAFIVAIGGKLISNQETYKQLCTLVKSFGATRIRGVARESIARLWKRYGFEERYILVEAKL